MKRSSRGRILVALAATGAIGLTLAACSGEESREQPAAQSD